MNSEFQRRGVTWSEPFYGKDEKGSRVSPEALVRLSGKAIGMVTCESAPGNSYGSELLFRRSDDTGKTWSSSVSINSKGSSAFMLQDVLLRTDSGRIILPVYLIIGQGGDFGWHMEEQPFVGGFVNGNFVSTDAHFYDPHFGASYVFFSDDDGKSWQRNRDGELFILLNEGSRIESTFEPSVAEVAPGKLLMLMRSRLGRYFQAWSQDNGETWTRPQPTQLAGTQAPAQIRTFKKTGHLLCIFTQQSSEEVRKGFIRTRLRPASAELAADCGSIFRMLRAYTEKRTSRRARSRLCVLWKHIRYAREGHLKVIPSMWRHCRSAMDDGPTRPYWF